MANINNYSDFLPFSLWKRIPLFFNLQRFDRSIFPHTLGTSNLIKLLQNSVMLRWIGKPSLATGSRDLLPNRIDVMVQGYQNTENPRYWAENDRRLQSCFIQITTTSSFFKNNTLLPLRLSIMHLNGFLVSCHTGSTWAKGISTDDI